MKYKFHEGQRVRIVGNSAIYHYAVLGSVGTITELKQYGLLPLYQVQCETTNGRNRQVIIEKDLIAVGAKVV